MSVPLTPERAGEESSWWYAACAAVITAASAYAQYRSRRHCKRKRQQLRQGAEAPGSRCTAPCATARRSADLASAFRPGHPFSVSSAPSRALRSASGAQGCQKRHVSRNAGPGRRPRAASR